MEFNPVIEGRKKMQELFDKIEQLLSENMLVIADIQAKASRNECAMDEELV